ncbi:MAG: KpsF/GutQ family sugar-phosphate isomerase [Hyphomicrobium sp.]
MQKTLPPASATARTLKAGPARGASRQAHKNNGAKSKSAKTAAQPQAATVSAKRAPSNKAALESAVRTLKLEGDGLSQLAKGLKGAMAAPFLNAVARLSAISGRVIVTGIGKSGHVGQKIAATFASTGTPAFFVHPSEASHGDLGMITPADVILALSWSGETVELKPIITYSRRFKVPLISITSRAESALGQQSDIALLLPRAKEACPHGLAPTTSTTMQLALGDALAIALLEAKGFTAHDFKVFHPGGSLGANLKYVADVMHKGDDLPIAHDRETMSGALVTMTAKSFGCLGIVDGKGRLAGVITDGDLRRHMGAQLLSAKVGEIMTRNPKTVGPQTLASAALEVLNASRITALFVVADGRPVGIVHIHDLLRAGVA